MSDDFIKKGKAFKFGDDISTDLIAPGRLFHLRNDLEEFSKHVLEDADPDFAKNVQNLIESYTETKFPASGNIAISVNSAITSKIIDIQNLKPLPAGIRAKQKKNGICAIGFLPAENNKKQERKQILISFDNLLYKLIGGTKWN